MQSKKEITTKKGDRMAFVQFEDLSGRAEIIVFPKLFKKVESLLDSYNAFIVKGEVDLASREKCKILASELLPIDLLFEGKATKAMKLELPEFVDEALCEKIKKTLISGDTPTTFSFKENNLDLTLKSRSKSACSLETLEELKKLGLKTTLLI